MVELVQGDSLSKLLQTRAALLGIRLSWTGRAIDDIDMLCLEYMNRKAMNECLWNNGLVELWKMPEINELPEALKAKISSIILQAQAHFELGRAQKLQEKKP